MTLEYKYIIYRYKYIYIFFTDMETPKSRLNLPNGRNLKLLTYALLTLFACWCNSKSPQDIVSGIRTDWDNRRKAESFWLEYQNVEKSSTNQTDIYELRALQAEMLKTSDELTSSRDAQIKELWRAERRQDRKDRRNSRNNKSQKDPLNWKNINWDPSKGSEVDELLNKLYNEQPWNQETQQGKPQEKPQEWSMLTRWMDD